MIIKKGKLCICVLCILFLVSACSHGVDAHDSHGHPIRLSDYLGKWVFINYWAMWCKPCLTEIPALEKLYEQHKNKVIILGVSYETLSNQDIRKVANKFGITYPMLSSFPMQKLGTNNISVLPMTFIISPQGHLYKVLKGPQSEHDLLNAIGLTSRMRL